ncbi:MAG: OmpH family outer membrane protein [Planctomycetota bacterium]
MKKIIISTSIVVCMVGLGLALTNAWGQGAAKTAVESGPHKVGLIDMAFLFSKYSKFETLRADLKAEIETADASLKARLEKIKGLQAEMKDLVPNSPDFVAREKQITELAAAAEAERKNLQRKFMREETKVYQTVYREVLDAVNKYAAIYKYTLIIRYSRDEAAEAGDDPQKVMQALQRQVVFNRAEDDVTDAVLRYLNNQYKPATRSATKPDTKTRGVSTN